jgi:glycosyltransferase involved in cell wall biosynthesis
MEPLDLERRALAEWPVVKLMHGYSGTCISALKTHGFPRRVACGRTLGPACLALYVPRHCGPLRPASLVSGYRWAVAQRALFTEYSAVIVASAHMEDELLRHGVSRERLAVIPMFPTIAPGTEPAGGRDVVLFLGRMTDLKGGDVLIRAVARASRAMRRLIPLLMAGDGPQRAAWERLAAREQVAAGFPGWLADEARSAALARAAVLAVPSIWPEPFGLVGLEAAARGVPSVAFDVGGISTWLRHGVSGLLVDPSAGEIGLASAIEKILEDHALRERLGGGALAVAREMSLDAHMRQLEMVLQRAARGLSSGAGQP